MKSGWMGLILVFLLWASPAHAQQKWGLLIGIDHYRERDRINDLSSAARDARALKNTLVEAGGFAPDHVMLLVSDARSNLTEEAMPDRNTILRELAGLSHHAKPGDLVFVAFSGHGMLLNGKSYLLPYDADPLDETTLAESSIETATFENRLKDVPASLLVLAFDMCRVAPLKTGKEAITPPNLLTGEHIRGLDFALPNGKTGNGSPRAIATFYSCSEGQQSFEWTEKQRSFFSYYLEEGLSGGAADKGGIVRLDALISYLRERVPAAVRENQGKDQTPLIKVAGAATDRLVLATKRADVRGRLKIVVEPPSAVVVIDGIRLDTNEYVTDLHEEPTRSVQVTVTASGYAGQVFKATLERGQLITLPISLDKLPETPGETKAAAPPPTPPVAKATVRTPPENLIPVPLIKVEVKDVLKLKAPRTLKEYKEQMALIPAGTFYMGSNMGNANEKPVHKVSVASFKMGRTPVTVAMWKEYCRKTGQPAPKLGPNFDVDDQPIINISWQDAKDYCDWAGLKLPTEEQWEYASSARRRVTYPWGNTFDLTKVTWARNSGGHPAPVYRPDRVYVNPFGLVDMAGNMWEWCGDVFTPYEGGPPVEPNRKGFPAWRGGAWDDYDEFSFRTTWRGNQIPTERRGSWGFRCAAPADVPEKKP